MSNYNCYIVDDEADSIEILQDYIDQTPGLRLAYSTTDPRDIFSVIGDEDNPKITFLDIEMPGITGLELAGMINSHTAIIFVTSHTGYALQAFEKDAYDFLVKPVSYKRFLNAVIKVKSRMANNLNIGAAEKKYFFIRGSSKGELNKIFIDEVLYIESLQNYVRIYTSGNAHITYLTLKECEFKLNQKNFIKVHKSFVVNLDRIVRHINNQLTMENKGIVPIGSVYRPELMIKLKSKIFSTDRREGAE